MKGPRLLFLPAALLALLALVSTAAATEIVPGSTDVEILDTAGQSDARAAAHPDRVIVSLELTDPHEQQMKEVVASLPRGFGAELLGFPTCPRSSFSAAFFFPPKCPPEARIGTLEWERQSGGLEELPFYNVEPGPNELASLGGVWTLPLTMDAHMTADNRVELRMSDLPPAAFDGRKVRLEVWGVPADHLAGGPYPRRPFLITPTRCDVVPTGSVAVKNWEEPDRWLEVDGDLGHPFADCGSVPFDPSVSVSLDDPRADSPTGATVDLRVPQSDDPEGRASSQIRSVRASLPDGLTVAPGAAAGLATCSDQQFGQDSTADPSCPGGSKVGSVEFSSPTLQHPASGAVYLGQERPGERFRLLVAVPIPGSTIKFTGALRPDKQTGRLVADLEDMPEVPTEDLSLRFFGGADAMLATPLSCGTASGSVELTPYSGTGPVTRSLSVPIAPAGGGSCGAPGFAPSFSGGGDDTRAGQGGTFAATIRRRDGEANLDRLTVDFPPGAAANLGSVPRCGSDQAAAGSCPAGSRIGSAEAELGPGDHPARLAGDVFLTGPYKGAPFGVAIAFGGRIGPFDFGTTVVRGKLDLDSQSGQVSLATDSLPRLIEGVGVRFETISLRIDRPGFMRNPTSCDQKAIGLTLTSQSGQIAKASTPFRVGGCVALSFHPTFGMALKGASQMGKGGRPALEVTVKSRPKDANLRGAKFDLPSLLAFNGAGLRALCARPAAEAGECRKSSKIGTAKAITPLLKAPLGGTVHVVQPQGNKGTPDLWAQLQGEGVEINLQIDTSEEKGHFGGGLEGLPDIPLRSFSMDLASGKHSLVVLERGLCRGRKPLRLSSPIELEGQNDALLQTRIPVKTSARCGGR